MAVPWTKRLRRGARSLALRAAVALLALLPLRAALADKPFAVLAVQMNGSARTAKDAAADLGLHFPLLPDRDARVTNSWNVTVLPTSFLIAPDGTVAVRQLGGTDWSSPKWRRKIESLLQR